MFTYFFVRYKGLGDMIIFVFTVYIFTHTHTHTHTYICMYACIGLLKSEKLIHWNSVLYTKIFICLFTGSDCCCIFKWSRQRWPLWHWPQCCLFLNCRLKHISSKALWYQFQICIYPFFFYSSHLKHIFSHLGFAWFIYPVKVYPTSVGHW